MWLNVRGDVVGYARLGKCMWKGVVWIIRVHEEVLRMFVRVTTTRDIRDRSRRERFSSCF